MGNSPTRRQAALAVAGGALSPFLAPLSALAQSPAAVGAEAIAKEGYIYGFPAVDLYRILWGYFADKGGPAYKAPPNTLFNTAGVYTPADKTIQTPNSDTPYSFALFDLRAEPWVVSLPAIEEKRYYSVQFVDLYTYNSFYLGTRATGNGGGDFLVTGPNWNGMAPSGIKKVLKADTDLMLALYRTQLFGPSDLDNVEKVQAGYKIAPLSKYAGTAVPPPAPAIDWIAPLSSENERSSPKFFDVLSWVLKYCPPFSNEVALRARIASLAGADQKAIAAGMNAAQKEIDAKRATLTSSSALFGSRATLGTNYLNRALAAQGGILGNTAAEAVYVPYQTDARGKQLSGSTSYALRFAPGKLPPVKAFWSLTMYDLPKQLLVANSLNRYLINSPMLPNLKKDQDGGITLYVGAASPGKARESNWLPAPAGPFFMVLRCYYPEQPVLDGTWKAPPLTAAP